MQTWEIVRVFTAIPRQPHDKLCICIDPGKAEVFFINSEPPRARRARLHAVEVSRHECHVVSHSSYIDTTDAVPMPTHEWVAALADSNRHLGRLSPTLIARIQQAIRGQTQLTAHQRRVLGV